MWWMSWGLVDVVGGFQSINLTTRAPRSGLLPSETVLSIPSQSTFSNQPVIEPLLPLAVKSVRWNAAQPTMW